MVNPKSFFLARWDDKNGVEQVLVAQYPTMAYLYDLGSIPKEARLVEAAHPENLRMDMVFHAGRISTIEEMIEDSRKVVKIWGLFDHENTLHSKVDSQNQEEATDKLLDILKFNSLPPMWRVLGMVD